jgi:hypothetical protein
VSLKIDGRRATGSGSKVMGTLKSSGALQDGLPSIARALQFNSSHS